MSYSGSLHNYGIAKAMRCYCGATNTVYSSYQSYCGCCGRDLYSQLGGNYTSGGSTISNISTLSNYEISKKIIKEEEKQINKKLLLL